MYVSAWCSFLSFSLPIIVVLLTAVVVGVVDVALLFSFTFFVLCPIP